MRGKVNKITGKWDLQRITPAYAGKSVVHGPVEPVIGDHPRVCGEKCKLLYFQQLNKGSPPRMRGKVTVVVRLTVADRITPAYAGKSFLKSRTGEGVRDHPRVCGEKTKKIP